MSLFSNPIGWADKAVGNNRRFMIMLISHVLLLALFISGFIIFDEVREVAIPAISIYFFSVSMAFYYLYALKKLLEEVKRQK